MNCFEHDTKVSVGQCAYCFKGVCKDCINIQDHVLSCKNKVCKTAVSENIEILLRTKRIYGIGKNSKKKLPMTSLFFMMFGVMFSISPLYRLVQGGGFDVFDSSSGILGIGCIFFVWGLYRFLQKDKMYF